MGIIYFARHGETDIDKQKRFNGGIDFDLNETGIRQSETLAEKLADIKFDTIFSSPKKRAVQTCGIVANGKEFTIDDRIGELVCGVYDGKKKNLFVKIRFLLALNKGKRGVEHLDDFKARSVSFLESIVESSKDKTVLVVSHTGNATAFDYFFKGQPKKYSFGKSLVKNGEVLKFEF